MNASLDWAESVATRTGPRFLAIADAIGRAIDDGALAPGDRLPAHRTLATHLALDVSTVSRAYAEIQRRGLTVGEVGRGTFVRKRKLDAPVSLLRDGVPGDFLDLSHNFPAGAPANPAAALLERAAQGLFDMPELVGLQADIGLPAHRRDMVQWLAGAGIDALPGEVMVTSGAQHGVLLALQAVSEPDGVVLVESTTFYGALSAARFLGRRVVPVEIDAEGMVPAALRQALARTGAKVVYCNPTLLNPTTALMGMARREAVVALCRQFDATIVEDDVYGFLLAPHVATLCALAPERTIHVSGFSKIVGPGLRVGFVKAPAHLVPRMGTGLRASTLMAPAPMVELVARLVRSGDMQRLADARRQQVVERQAWAGEMLQDAAAQRHASSFHVWLRVGDWSSEGYAAVARERGVGVAPGALFSFEPEVRGKAAVRICISAAPDRQRLQHGLRVLRALAAESPYAARAVV